MVLAAILLALPAFAPRAAAQDGGKPSLASLAKPSAVSGPKDPEPTAAPGLTILAKPSMPAPIPIAPAPLTIQTVAPPQPPRPSPPSVQPPRVSPPRVGGK